MHIESKSIYASILRWLAVTPHGVELLKVIIQRNVTYLSNIIRYEFDSSQNLNFSVFENSTQNSQFDRNHFLNIKTLIVSTLIIDCLQSKTPLNPIKLTMLTDLRERYKISNKEFIFF